MKIKYFAASALVGALLLGCDMPMPGQPATTQSPAPGASSSPSGGTTVGTGAALNYWKLGRKWEYTLSVQAAGTTTGGTVAWEVTKIEGNMVTLKTTTKVGSTPEVVSESTFDASKQESAAMANQGSDVTMTLESTTKEAVTVPAGTYPNATKYVYKMSGKASGTSTAWVDDAVGLVKSVSSTQVDAPQMPQLPGGLPGGVTLPGGGSLDLSSNSTMELKSFQ